jgi:oligosaccharyltransferase complex subunit alpha (ribophorin I)
VTFPSPVPAGESLTMSVSYALVSLLQPLPALIEQTDSQTVTYSLSAKLPSAYKSALQKTKLWLPTSSPADFTRLAAKNADGAADPTHQGSSLTYGPYKDVGPSAAAEEPVSVRYEYTHPLLRATRFERDVEVSHWGGNAAVEERYWLTNRAARLKSHFSRVSWQMSQYGPAAGHTTAAKELRLTMGGGAVDAYYTDDIGNVSTSRFNPGRKESALEIKPRYPVFGGWNYSFKVGWNTDLARFLRRGDGDRYVLKVPFMEGPKTPEGIEYGKVTVRVILPEGAQ